MKVAVLGAGAWGTALARVCVERGAETVLWSWQEAHVEAMRLERENRQFFAGVPLPPAMKFSSDLAEAVSEADLLLLVIPSHAFRATLERVRPVLRPETLVVSATKGIEVGTGMLMSEVLGDVLGAVSEEQAVVLSGPSFAREVAERAPTNLVAASKDPERARRVQEFLSGDWLRVYTSGDPVGVEVGGALKNVIAIAAGACDGFGLGHNTRAALITRGIAEMSRLAVAKGGEARTLAGLAGMGDLVLTCTGDLSRNRTLGQKLGKGIPLAEALATSDGVAEGYGTAQSAHELAVKLGVDLPICGAVHAVLHQGVSPEAALRALLGRPLRGEWEELPKV